MATGCGFLGIFWFQISCQVPRSSLNTGIHICIYIYAHPPPMDQPRNEKDRKT